MSDNNDNSMPETPPRSQVLVGIPCYTGEVAAETVNGLLNSINLFHGISWGIGCCHIGIARDNIVSEFLNGGWNKLVFIDTDIVFTPQQFQRIISYNMPVVAGVYKTRSVDGDLTLCPWKSGPVPEHRELAHVRRAATGFMAIQRSVFTTIQERFPERAYKSKMGPRYNFFPAALIHDPNSNEMVVQTDDYGFCDLVNSAGLSVHVDLGVCVGHKGHAIYQVNLPAIEPKTEPGEPCCA